MILDALCGYYDRRREEGGALPEFGFEIRPIDMLIVLDGEGRFVDLEDTRRERDGRLVARRFEVPQACGRSGGHFWKNPYILWDHTGFVLGDSGDPDRANKDRKSHWAFKRFIEHLFGAPPAIDEVAAVWRFLKRGDVAPVTAHPLWDELTASGARPRASFRIRGQRAIVPELSEVRAVVRAWAAEARGDEEGRCLVTGERQPIARTHPKIKGVGGAYAGGANLVSFNRAAYTSHGHTQGFNAPVGVRTAFRYTTALNALLGDDDRRLHFGDYDGGGTTVVFWADRTSELEDLLARFGLAAGGNAPTPDRRSEAVARLYEGPRTGVPAFADDDTRFFVLGLSPARSRPSVRFFHHGTVAEMAGRFRAYFDDIRIERPPSAVEYPRLIDLIASTVPNRDYDRIPAHRVGAVFRAILTGRPYPSALFRRPSCAVMPNRASPPTGRRSSRRAWPAIPSTPRPP